MYINSNQGTPYSFYYMCWLSFIMTLLPEAVYSLSALQLTSCLVSFTLFLTEKRKRKKANDGKLDG